MTNTITRDEAMIAYAMPAKPLMHGVNVARLNIFGIRRGPSNEPLNSEWLLKAT